MKLFTTMALAALGTAGMAQGAVVMFGTSSSVVPTETPNIVLDTTAGQTTATLYVWARRSGGAGYVNGLGLNVVEAGTAKGLLADGFSVANPDNGGIPGDDLLTRWDAVVAPTLNSTPERLVFDSRAFSVAQGFSPLNQNNRLHATFTFRVDPALIAFATSNVEVPLFLQVSPFTISESNGASTSQFGFGDAPITSAGGQSVFNTQSALPDAIITIIIPEPASMGLAGVGALGLLARRRRA